MLLLIRKDTEEDRVLKPSTQRFVYTSGSDVRHLTLKRSIREPSSEFFVFGKTPI